MKGEEVFQAQEVGHSESVVGTVEHSKHRRLPNIPVGYHDTRTSVALSDLADGLVVAAMPAYNEEPFIAKVISGARKYVDLVLVVDDGSSDATVEIARTLGAKVIKHETNLGYGRALQTIFEASRAVQASALVILDSDGQHTPDNIPLLLAGLDDGADIVIGSRFLEDSKGEIPAYRRIGIKILDKMTEFASRGLHVSDSQSGFRAYSPQAIEVMHLSSTGMSAGSEVLIKASEAGLVIAEVPVTVRYDIPETSSQHPVSHGISVLTNIIRVVGCRRPLFFFGIPGLIFTSFGVGAGFSALVDYSTTAQVHTLLFVGGIASLALGLVLICSFIWIMHLGSEGTKDSSAFHLLDNPEDKGQKKSDQQRCSK